MMALYVQVHLMIKYWCIQLTETSVDQINFISENIYLILGKILNLTQEEYI